MNQSDIERRGLLQAAALLVAGAGVGALGAGPARAAELQSKPGDFAFLAGEWRIHHRKLKAAGSDEWIEFEGEATCWSILNGVGSIEELRIPSSNFIGLGLRLLDVANNRWADYWIPGWTGVLTPPPTWGGFVDGAGVFIAEDVDGDVPIRIRGLWDGITPTSCRWSQAISRDGGVSWADNWLMQWTRVPARG